MSDQPIVEDSTCTTHNTHNRQTSMPTAGFEPATPESEWLQTYALDRAATETGITKFEEKYYTIVHVSRSFGGRILTL